MYCLSDRRGGNSEINGLKIIAGHNGARKVRYKLRFDNKELEQGK